MQVSDKCWPRAFVAAPWPAKLSNNVHVPMLEVCWSRASVLAPKPAKVGVQAELQILEPCRPRAPAPAPGAMKLGMQAQVSVQDAWRSRAPVVRVTPASIALDKDKQIALPGARWPWASMAARKPVKVEEEVQLQMLEP